MKKTKKKVQKKVAKKETVPGARFEGVKKLLAQMGVKVKKVTSKTICNFGDCKKKLPIHGELNGVPVSRARWCDEHRLLTNKARNYFESLRKRGHSLKKLPPNRYDVRGGKLTLWAQLHGVDPEKAMAEYKAGRRGREYLGLDSPKTKQKKAAAKVGKKLAKAAKKVKKHAAKVKEVKAAPKPGPKKVPPRPTLKALMNGKGADVQAAVAAHAAVKGA